MGMTEEIAYPVGMHGIVINSSFDHNGKKLLYRLPRKQMFSASTMLFMNYLAGGIPVV